MAEKVSIKENETIIDVGCGLAGPARFFADKFKCNVVGVDITPAFIEVGNDFNKRTNMHDKVSLHVTDGKSLPFENNQFDAAISQHVTMNVENRELFFTEIFRVLKKDTFFAFSEHGLGPKGTPYFPLPWADDEKMSFLLDPKKTIELLKEIGFKIFPSWKLEQNTWKVMKNLLKLTLHLKTYFRHACYWCLTMYDRQKNSMLSIKEKELFL